MENIEISSADNRERVLMLPMIYNQEATNLEDYTTYFTQAKAKNIDQIMLVSLEALTTKPVQQGSGNTYVFVGFEGPVTYRVEYFDVATGEKTFSQRITDNNEGNAKGVKSLINTVGAFKKNSNSSGLNDLVDSFQEKTKKDALEKAIRQSGRGLKRHWAVYFPQYFEVLEVGKMGKKTSFTIEGGSEQGLQAAQKITIISRQDDGTETEIGQLFIKNLGGDNSDCLGKKKVAEAVANAHRNGQQLLARVTTVEFNMLAKGAGMLKQ